MSCAAIQRALSRFYGLDACMADLMRPGMYGAYHHITVPDREGGETHVANVVGTLCENNDWYLRRRAVVSSASRSGTTPRTRTR